MNPLLSESLKTIPRFLYSPSPLSIYDISSRLLLTFLTEEGEIYDKGIRNFHDLFTDSSGLRTADQYALDLRVRKHKISCKWISTHTFCERFVIEPFDA